MVWQPFKGVSLPVQSFLEACSSLETFSGLISQNVLEAYHVKFCQTCCNAGVAVQVLTMTWGASSLWSATSPSHTPSTSKSCRTIADHPCMLIFGQRVHVHVHVGGVYQCLARRQLFDQPALRVHSTPAC